MRAEIVVYRGITFRRYPESKNWADRNYYRPHAGHIRRGVETLHREIWKDNFGPIPDGHHVHHRNDDTSDNSPGNLECKDGFTHLSEHWDDEQRVRAREAFLQNVIPAARAWHSTDAGKAWHSQNGVTSYAKRVWRTLNCDECGGEYRTQDARPKTRFCHLNCKMRAFYRRRREAKAILG